ncbi:MAG: acyl-CoA carboxylase subunit epsilon [Geodermatophilaceae bacterium]
MEANAESAPPFLRIVRGEPTAEELAALVSVLAAVAGARRAAAPPPAPTWSAASRSVRTALSPGHGGWRASALPR